jgi:hypothetical protein
VESKPPVPAPDASTRPTPEMTQDIAGFLLKLGRALHTYGTPSHRTEEALSRIAARLGLRGQFLVTPTSILASFGEDDHQITRLARVEPGETDLQKLTRLHLVMRDVFGGVTSPRRARDLIDAIVQAPASYGAIPTLIGFALTSGAAARFFDGGLAEIVASVGLGLLVGLAGDREREVRTRSSSGHGARRRDRGDRSDHDLACLRSVRAHRDPRESDRAAARLHAHDRDERARARSRRERVGASDRGHGDVSPARLRRRTGQPTGAGRARAGTRNGRPRRICTMRPWSRRWWWPRAHSR